MNRGPKPQLPATKLDKGTYQPCRDANRVEIIAPDALPQKPDWLTAAGEEVWMDEIGRAAQMKLVSEADTTMFGNYCNLQGYIIMAWRKHRPANTSKRRPPSPLAIERSRTGSPNRQIAVSNHTLRHLRPNQ